MIENQNTTRKVASHFAFWIVTDIQIHQVKIPQIPLGASFFQRIYMHKLAS